MTASDLTPQIVGELYKAVSRWTEDPELLSIIGSWRDTLEDSEILALFKDYNESGGIFHEQH